MKHLTIVVFSILALVSCKQSKEQAEETVDYSEEKLDVATSIYPDNISKIFKAHGGIDNWNKYETLYFEIEKDNENEKTTTLLKSRESVIDLPKHKIGFDGKNVWLLNKDETKYEGNAKFYYNLMFYFYAMPFVLADDGVIYKDVEPLVYEGKSYPGILIAYESGIGESPEDEYIVYYNPETFKMEWLAYTVTYFSKEKSKKFKLIRYSDWEKIGNFNLPKILDWYTYENGKIGEIRNTVNFVNASINYDKTSNTQFAKPEKAEITN